MQISRIDHIVLIVRDIATTAAFYEWVLGLDVREYETARFAIFFDNQKINLHQHGRGLRPLAAHPTPGSDDVCLITQMPLPDVIRQLEASGVDIVLGPVHRTGAGSRLESIYVHDPDENLIEIANILL